jgi:hypothetical protein
MLARVLARRYQILSGEFTELDRLTRAAAPKLVAQFGSRQWLGLGWGGRSAGGWHDSRRAEPWLDA